MQPLNRLSHAWRLPLRLRYRLKRPAPVSSPASVGLFHARTNFAKNGVDSTRDGYRLFAPATTAAQNPMMTIQIEHGSTERWLDQHEAETGETPAQFVRRMAIGQMAPDAPWSLSPASGPLSPVLFQVPSRMTA